MDINSSLEANSLDKKALNSKFAKVNIDSKHEKGIKHESKFLG